MHNNPQKKSVFIGVHLWFNSPAHLLFLLSLCSLAAIPSFADLEWQSTSKSFTVHPLQASQAIGFPFTNTGSEPITILKLQPGCGCLSGTVEKKEYAVGESGIIHVTFNLEKRLGAQRKGIAVKTSDNPKKPTTLYVGTSIPKTYTSSVKRLIWSAGEEHAAKSCRLTNHHKDPFRLIKAVPAREDVKLELKPIREGYEYELIVQPSASLKNVVIPIRIHPEIPEGLDKVKTFTVYALLK